MVEPLKRQLSRAEVYGESVLRRMKKKPADCYLFNALVPEIGNNGLIVYGGTGGGSMSLAVDYLQKLSDIHRPHCKQKTPHSINIR